MNWTTDEEKKVELSENKITLRASLLIKDKGCYVEFPKKNSLVAF